MALLLSERPPVPTGGAGAGGPSLRQAVRNPNFRLLYASMFVMSQGLFVP